LCDGAPEPTPGDAVPEGFTVLHMPTGPVLDVGVGHHLELAWLCDGDARGRIRWELRTGTGHGARLVLTHTGSATDQEQRALALTAWRDRINELARSATAPAST
jgi:hypothetical protein